MKRDWDVIRDVLIEVEGLDADQRNTFAYGIGHGYDERDELKSEHAFMLWRGDFLNAIDASTNSARALLSPNLTWEGHDLLETIRSKVVWERIKSTAKDKGIELTLDAVKALAKVSLNWIIEG